jgi:hypothetical protein
MEKAFQRQVIYGGSLDTILLEMNLVPEERLTQYLALASGLPPAARDEGGAIEPSALALITAEIAAQFARVPLSIDGDALRVLVCSPLEISELEDLADLLDRPAAAADHAGVSLAPRLLDSVSRRGARALHHARAPARGRRDARACRPARRA